MEKPLLSICIPNYNNATFLRACLESALSQTSYPTEVIVVDDSSTDDSCAVIAEFGDRVRFFKNETNQGQANTTTKAVELAKGYYCVILHSDDMLAPGFSRTLVPMLDANPTAVLAVGERLEMDHIGNTREITPFYNGDYFIPGTRQAKVFLFASFLPCQVMFVRNCLFQAGGIDPAHTVNLDGLLWFRISLLGDVVYTQSPVGYYRSHTNSTTSQYNRTIDHMIEYYGTLKAMFQIAKGNVFLESHFPSAIKRVGQLTLRYIRKMIDEKNYALARRHLSLALFFDPELSSDDQFQLLSAALTSVDPEAECASLLKPSCRIKSYEPPEGSLQLGAKEQLSVLMDWLRSRPNVIYGAGKIGSTLARALKSQGIQILEYWDNKATLGAGPENIPIKRPPDNLSKLEYNVIVTIFAPSIRWNIANDLRYQGLRHVMASLEPLELLFKNICEYEELQGKYHFDLLRCHQCPASKNTGARCALYEKHTTQALVAGLENPLVIPSMGLLVHNKCNLTCVGCNHLRDLYKPSDNIGITASTLISDMDTILDAVDAIERVVVVGGEALLHKELPSILGYILAQPRIGSIQLITNGTVPVPDDLIAMLNHPKIVVEVSGYGSRIALPLQKNLNRFLDKLSSYNVCFQHVQSLQWFDFGDFRHRQLEPHKLEEIYRKCCFVSNDLFDGKLHKCSRSVFAQRLGHIPNYPQDYVDIRHTPSHLLRDRIREFLLLDKPEVCQHCNGTSELVIPAGIQKQST